MIEQRVDVGGWQVRWNPAVARLAAAEGLWPDRTVAQLAAELAATEPDRILIVDGDLQWTAGQLYDRARRLAGWFVETGLVPGDVISFQLPNWWEANVINLAAAMAGVVVNPIVPINRDAEVSYMLAAARSRVMFVPEAFRRFGYAEMMQRVLPTLDPAPEVVVLRGDAGPFTSFDTLLQTEPLAADRPVAPDAVKLLMYTSGTTGRPKAVLHSHNSVHADGIKMRRHMRLDSPDVIFCGSPLTHVSGYLWILNVPWLTGMKAVSLDQWEIGRAFALLRDHGCTVMVGATPFLQDLVSHIEETGETLPLLRQYICGGAAVPPGLIYRATELLPNCIAWRTFGSTETTTLTCCPTRREDVRLGAETDGRICGVEVRVRDIATGKDVPAGEEGELLARGPGMMLGYANPADNEAAFDAEGYFHMGDLVRIVDTDHIVCTGRVKDLIIRAGENISAKEIEDVLMTSPAIAEAAVVSMPSAKTGEAICAFIVARNGRKLTLAEIDALIRTAGLARQKTPEHIEYVDAFPKTPAGKVRKDVLRKMAADFVPGRG